MTRAINRAGNQHDQNNALIHIRTHVREHSGRIGMLKN